MNLIPNTVTVSPSLMERIRHIAIDTSESVHTSFGELRIIKSNAFPIQEGDKIIDGMMVGSDGVPTYIVRDNPKR